MRAIITSLALSLTVGLGACATTPMPLRADLAVRNVHIVDTRTGRVLADRTLLIRGDRIAAIADASALHAAEREVDGQGAFAIPGLWDAHIHLLQDDAALALGTAPVLLSYGVTHARDMGSSARALTAFKAGAQSSDLPVIIASGPPFWAIELPYGDKSQQRIVGDAADIEAAVRETAAAGADLIKIYAGFEPGPMAVLMDAARAQGLRVAGHAQPGAPLDAQARLGLATVEHLETSTFVGCDVDPDAYFERIIAARFRGSGETQPAIFTAFVADIDRDACVAMFRRAADAGLAITPTLMASFLPPTTARRLAADLPPGQRESCDLYLAAFSEADQDGEAAYMAAGNALMEIVHASGMPILAGTDAPAFCGTTGASLAVELELLQLSGLSPLEVLQSATLTPARVFGFGDRLGAIEPGMEADFVLLRQNPLVDVSAYAEPVGLFSRGKWRDQTELMRLRRSGPSN